MKVRKRITFDPITLQDIRWLQNELGFKSMGDLIKYLLWVYHTAKKEKPKSYSTNRFVKYEWEL